MRDAGSHQPAQEVGLCQPHPKSTEGASYAHSAWWVFSLGRARQPLLRLRRGLWPDMGSVGVKVISEVPVTITLTGAQSPKGSAPSPHL